MVDQSPRYRLSEKLEASLDMGGRPPISDRDIGISCPQGDWAGDLFSANTRFQSSRTIYECPACGERLVTVTAEGFTAHMEWTIAVGPLPKPEE